MPGISATLEIAKNTLLNSQLLMQTVSHNIANADSKIYARQKGLLATNLPVHTNSGWVGMGASITRIVQQRDQFVEKRLLDSISKEAGYEARAGQLSLASDYLSDDGEYGISQALGKFWDAWDSLNNNPDGASEKSILIQAAKDLASTVSNTYNGLETHAATIEEEIDDLATQANGLLSDIASYNDQIMKAELAANPAQPANDLRDLRYQAVTKLAELLPISYSEESNGTLTITLNDENVADAELVTGKDYFAISYDSSAHQLLTASGESVDTIDGRMGALQDAYRTIKGPLTGGPSYMDRLNALAASIADRVNSLHGTEVFDAGALVSGSEARTIKVSGVFQPDASKALSIAGLQNDTANPLLGGVTFQKYLADIQQRVGSEQQSAASRSDFYGALRQQLEAEQQSASGVSIDEEMVELLKFQQIYQAAAKVIRSSSEMLDAVINMV